MSAALEQEYRERRASSPAYSTSFEAGLSRGAGAIREANAGDDALVTRRSYGRCSDIPMQSGFLARVQLGISKTRGAPPLQPAAAAPINQRRRLSAAFAQCFDEGFALAMRVATDIRNGAPIGCLAEGLEKAEATLEEDGQVGFWVGIQVVSAQSGSTAW